LFEFILATCLATASASNITEPSAVSRYGKAPLAALDAASERSVVSETPDKSATT